MSALDEAAEIVSRKWKSGGEWFKVLLVLAAVTAFVLLLAYFCSKLLRLMLPARINNRSLYFPRMRRYQRFKRT
jgi:flagellar biogenesis protein FliO